MMSSEYAKVLLISWMFSTVVVCSMSGKIKKMKSSPIFNIQMIQISHMGFRKVLLPEKGTSKSSTENTRSSWGRHFKSFILNEFYKNSNVYRPNDILRPPVQFMVNGKPRNTKWEKNQQLTKEMKNTIKKSNQKSKGLKKSARNHRNNKRNIFYISNAKMNGNPKYLYHLDYIKHNEKYEKYKI
jgi:hypothetical protein